MDKYEYNLKLEQIKELLFQGKNEEAAELADTINWNKIRNINDLVKAGEVYERVGRFQDSREILLNAYERSPIGRTIIYRLAEVAIKMEDFDGAEEYYKEFVDIAPHDNQRYILMYNIKRAQGASYEELIPILEEFKEQEYTEEWTFELAELYHKFEKKEKCVEACDELILWFGDGPYVEKALELKMQYEPLTKIQEEKYQQFQHEKEGKTVISVAEMEKAGEYVEEPVVIPQVMINSSLYNTTNLQQEIVKGMQEIMENADKGSAQDSNDEIKKIVEEIPYLQNVEEKSSQTEEKPASVDLEKKDSQQTLKDENSASTLEKKNVVSKGNTKHKKKDRRNAKSKSAKGSVSGNTKVSSVAEEKPQENVNIQVSSPIQETEKQKSITDILQEWEKTKAAVENVLQKAKAETGDTEKENALKEVEDIVIRLHNAIPALENLNSVSVAVTEENSKKQENISTKAIETDSLKEQEKLLKNEEATKSEERVSIKSDESINILSKEISDELAEEPKVEKAIGNMIRDLEEHMQDSTLSETEQEWYFHLTAEQKGIFSYFMPVKGMESQLCKALTGMIEHLNGMPNSANANLIIQGCEGCGKTVLAISIIKVLQAETGCLKGNIAKIDAANLNKKDIRQILKKVAGGCIIIEKAGQLDRTTAVTLSLLLEQEKSGILVILEDTVAGIKKVLLTDDRFAKKFTEVVTVPIFKEDDLIIFANSYANELGYIIDEMAGLALRSRISGIEKLDQETTLVEVKDIIDEAIEREANSGIRKAFNILTAKRYTDDDKIVLTEKDFE